MAVFFYILLILYVCYKVEQKFFFLFQRINVNEMREQESCLKTCQSIFYYYYNLVLPHLSFLRHGSPKIVKTFFFPEFPKENDVSVGSDLKKDYTGPKFEKRCNFARGINPTFFVIFSKRSGPERGPAE